MRGLSILYGSVLLLSAQLIAAQLALASRLVDFTKGDKPEAQAAAYSLRFAGASGIPNGIEEKGADASQIYISAVAKDSAAKLQVGDVVLARTPK
jgi:hypothetical protein